MGIDWSQVTTIAGTVITSFGGITVIVIATIKVSTGIITKRIEQGTQAKINNEFEKYKS